ncbi:NucA/NucB deoxyribonuclease domain-containing protein [Rhodococcus erythropolis]
MLQSCHRPNNAIPARHHHFKFSNYTSGGKECDEYPFASTYEGAAEHDYDPEAKKFNFSAKPIPKDDNQAGGLILKSFYAKNRIIDGLDDGFIVKILA